MKCMSATGGLLGSIAVCSWLACSISLWLLHANWVRLCQEQKRGEQLGVKGRVATRLQAWTRTALYVLEADMMELSGTLSVQIRKKECG